MIKKSEECRDKIVAILKEYDATIEYHSNNSFGDDGGIALNESKGGKHGFACIPLAKLKIYHSDWSM
jgi:hypothetical protein